MPAPASRGSVTEFVANTGFANVTNSGSITGTGGNGIGAGTNATVTNNAGATITGVRGISAATGFANVTNSGSITGTGGDGIAARTNATVTNNAGATITGTSNDGIFAGASATVTNYAAASITGGQYGIRANTGFANVANSGSITGTSGDGILAFTNATVTNNAGATITGVSGIYAIAGFADVTNSGHITGTSGNGIFASTNATVTNDAGASIAGGFSGISARFGFAHVVNSGSIEGAIDAGVVAITNATVTNNAGASIAGGLYGIRATAGGSSSVFNAGTITGFTNTGIAAGTSATVTNAFGASIAGGQYGIRASAGGSSVFNAGTISGGTAAIQFGGAGNTLTLAQGSVISGNVLGTGSDTFQLGGTGAATFDISTLGPAAQYQGFGTFNKIGSSVWTLTSTSTYAGDVNVDAGTLVVNGNLSSASIMMVNPDGTLAGTGTVPLTLVDNAATLAPGPLGSGTGSLTINERVMFCTCSTYAVKVSGTGNDFAQIMAGGHFNGDAFLDGAAVRVSSPTSTYRFNSPYTILTAQGGLNGTTFGSLALAAPPGIVGTLSYTANDVLLTLTSQLAQTAGLNQNQRAVATSLDTVFNAGNSTGGLGAIFAGNVAQNLTQASGETATGSQQATFDAMTQFLGLISDPFTAGRGDVGSNPTAFAGQGDAFNAFAATGRKRSGAERDAYGMITKAAPRAPLFEARWNVWAAGFGGSQTTGGNAIARVEHLDQPHRRRRGRRGLLAFATDRRRVCIGRGRHELQCGECRRRALRPVPGRRLRASHRWRRLYHRRGRLWLAGHHHRPHRYHCRDRSLARAVQCQCVVGPRRGRLSSCRAVDEWHRHHALCRGPSDRIRPAGLRRERCFRCRHLCVVVWREDRDGNAQRTWPALGQILCGWRCDPDAARARRLGARLQQQPRCVGDLPDAAGRILRRQRCRTGA